MPLPTQRAHADLSKSALAYATKKIEVEEVDFSVEINGLMGEKDISERVFGAVGGLRGIGPYLRSTAHGTHWRTEVGGGRVAGRGAEAGRRGVGML